MSKNNNNNYKLSAHFNIFEFQHYKYPHFLPPVDHRLIVGLEALRALANTIYRSEHHEEFKIKITRGGGWRSFERNKTTQSQSQHAFGRAADIVIHNSTESLTVPQMFELASKIPAFSSGGIGVYPNEHFIHVDTRWNYAFSGPARWMRVEGKYVELSEEYKTIERKVTQDGN